MGTQISEDIVTGMVESFCRGAKNETETVGHYRSLLAQTNKPSNVEINNLNFGGNIWSLDTKIDYSASSFQKTEVQEYGGTVQKPVWDLTCRMDIRLKRNADTNLLEMKLCITTGATYKMDVDIDKAMDGMATCVRN